LPQAVIGFQGSRVIAEQVIAEQQAELAAVDSWERLLAWRNKLVLLAEAYGKIGGCPMGSLANELAPTGRVIGRTSQPGSKHGPEKSSAHCSRYRHAAR